MRVVVAPDSFKGSFTAPEVAAAIGAGLERGGLEVDTCPVADGGEGTLDVLVSALGGRRVSTRVLDPLGREVDADYGVLGSTAVVEMAAASGLALLAPDELDPWQATTYGTGQLICAAAVRARHVLVTVGGSATVDGGRGALKAISRQGGVKGVKLTVLYDVRTPWERCAVVYGPQKGADPHTVMRLAARLRAFARRLPHDPRGVTGGGAAGGLAGALWATLDAKLEPGAPYVLDALKFDSRLEFADAVICGEGRIDSQSTEGKAVSEIAARARAAGISAHAIVGCNELDPEEIELLGLASVREASTLAELKHAGEQLAGELTSA